MVSIEMEKGPHALLLPFPAQGHVKPLFELGIHLLGHGFSTITFVNTQFNHGRLVSSSLLTHYHQIHLVSLPDGIQSGEDPNNVGDLFDSIPRVMPSALEELIAKINRSNTYDSITCVIADASMWWAFDVARKMGIPAAAFWPNSVGLLALIFHIPKLIEANVIDVDGRPVKEQLIELAPTLPAINTAHFVWHQIEGDAARKSFFGCLNSINHAVKEDNWILVNSFYEIEQSACKLLPRTLTIGPLHLGLGENQHSGLEGNFWPEDPTCLTWLNQQPVRSVIYVAFGSLTILDRGQFQELALGLEQSDHPFLWVVRSDLTDDSLAAYPEGFQGRIADHGRIVSWSPQQKVLSHPSIACFLTHCGWNSVLEGLSNGVPLLCWPYFADQFLNRTTITDGWKVGLGLEAKPCGIIPREEIKKRLEELIGDEGIKARCLEFKEMARKSVSQGGSSSKNLADFMEAIKSKAEHAKTV